MASRTDINQKPIVAALRRAGALVLHLHTLAHGAPDLLVFTRRSGFVLMEIKTARGTLTADEKVFHAIWPVVIVRSIDDALVAIGALPPPAKAAA